jgi:CTP:molybdopterin cytidylyltransferase MocA
MMNSVNVLRHQMTTVWNVDPRQGMANSLNIAGLRRREEMGSIVVHRRDRLNRY